MDVHQELRKFLHPGLGVSDRDLSLFLSSLTLRHLSKGDHFLNAGETNPIKGLVTKGCLRVYFTEADGTERVLYFAPEGWCLTNIGNAAGEWPAVLRVDALEPTDVLVIDRERLGTAAEPADDRIWRALAESALLTFQERLVGGLRKTAAQRYLDFRRLYPGLDSRIAIRLAYGPFGPSMAIASLVGDRPADSA